MKPIMFHQKAPACAILLLISTMAQAELRTVDNPAADGALAPMLAAFPDDSGAILSWLEKDGEQHVLRFSRYRNGGFAGADEIARGRDWFANWADTPGIHVRPDGTWLAHWLEKSADSTYAYDIRLTHSADDGNSWSAPRTPHADGTPTEHGFVSYFSARDGRTGMVWLDGRETLSAGETGHEHTGVMTLRTTTIDADGAPEPSLLVDGQVCDCCQTASANTELGPIIAYRNRTEDEIRDIAVVRQLPDGWTEPRLVHADDWKIGGCPVNGPSMIARGMQVVVAWFTMADGVPRVRFAISGDAGASFGEPTTLSPGSALGRVQLVWAPDGFVLAWMEENEGGAAGLRVARYSADGDLKSDTVLAQVDNGRVSGFPRMAVIGDQLLVAWTATIPDADRGNRTRIATGTMQLEDL